MAADEFARRRAALVRELPGRKLEAMVVAALPNIRYLTGFTGSNAALWIAPDEALLFTDPRYRAQARQQVTCKVRIRKGPLMPAVAAAAGRNRYRRIGFEPGRMTFEAYELLRSKLPMRAALHPAAGLVEKQRMIKSASEMARIRTSVETCSRAFEEALKRVRAGMTESQLAAELDYQMRRLGAEKTAFETIVAAGARAALPHAQPGAARLAGGDLVLVDMGAMRAGYASDMTRVFSLGPPSDKGRKIYRAVLEAQLAAIAAVKPGARTVDVDRAARKVLAAEGLERAFVHSTGHGLGLEIHEPPRLGRRDKGRLEAGMAVTIEPGAYLEGFGGIRIEDTVLVTPAGCEILTPTSKELRVV